MWASWRNAPRCVPSTAAGVLPRGIRVSVAEPIWAGDAVAAGVRPGADHLFWRPVDRPATADVSHALVASVQATFQMSRATNTSSLALDKGAYLQVPLHDLPLKDGYTAHTAYTLQMDLRLDAPLPHGHRLALFQAAWPRPHDTTEAELVCSAAVPDADCRAMACWAQRDGVRGSSRKVLDVGGKRLRPPPPPLEPNIRFTCLSRRQQWWTSGLTDPERPPEHSNDALRPADVQYGARVPTQTQTQNPLEPPPPPDQSDHSAKQ